MSTQDLFCLVFPVYMRFLTTLTTILLRLRILLVLVLLLLLHHHHYPLVLGPVLPFLLLVFILATPLPPPHTSF